MFTPGERNNIIALYDGEIRYTDETLIKPLISLLKKLNIYDDTLLVITSDHGKEFYEHNGWLHGRTLYEEQIKVPLIIKFPRSIYRGMKIKEKCRLIDIMPTILDVLSIKYKKNVLDGESLVDLITRKEQKDRIFISDLAYKDVPIPCPALIATNKDHMKLIVEKSSSRIKSVEIYDLEKDPKEQQNEFRSYSKFGRKLVQKLNNYYRKNQAVQRINKRIQLDENLKEKLRALGYIK